MDASTCITTLILAWEDVVNLPDVRRFFVTCLMLPKGKASTAFTSNTPETVVVSKSKKKMLTLYVVFLLPNTLIFVTYLSDLSLLTPHQME